MRVKKAYIVGTAILASAALAFAQSAAPPPPPAQTNPNAPALKVTSRVVQVNVIVRDKNGQPVTGLTKNDFTILDKGKPQAIASMTEQTNTQTSTTTVASLAPNSFSNRFQERYGVPPSVSVILIDALDTPPSLIPYARAQVTKFVGQLQPQDRVALYGLSDKIYILHDFTTDTPALLRAMHMLPNLQQNQGNASPGMDFALFTGDPMIDKETQWATEGVGRGADFDTFNRIGQTAAAIEAIANHLASLPGRKNLIWISASFPFQIHMETINPRSHVFGDQVEGAARALSNANVAIYPIYALGLTSSVKPEAIMTMVQLADLTGGRAIWNTNDISGAITRAIEDSRVTYMLTYYPNHNQWDGRFRDIKVRVNHPGVDVRSRRGYFAFPDMANATKSKEEVMVDAAKNPLEYAALGMDVLADPVDVAGARQIKTQVKLDPAQLLLAKNADRWTDTVDVKWVQLAADGYVLASTSQTLNLNIPQADYENVLRKGVTFSGAVKLVADATDVRVVARDEGNGSVGTVNISLARLFAPSPSLTPVKK